MTQEQLLIFSIFVSPILAIIITFISEYLITRNKNRKKKLLWNFQLKIENSFLLVEFSKKELKERKIVGKEENVIESFKNHFNYFQNLIISNGYYNKKISILINDEFLNNILRNFLVKWEKYNNYKKDLIFSDKEKNLFFEDLYTLKKEVKFFYEKNFSRISKEYKIFQEDNTNFTIEEMKETYISFEVNEQK